MATIKQTRSTIPTSSLIVEQALHCRGIVIVVMSLLWRSLERTLFNARRLGLSVYFISGSLLCSLILGILLIMIVPYDYLDNDRILTMPAILKNFYMLYHRSLP